VPRRNAKLMHNKFIVLGEAGKPTAVWTGSTNLSRNALHGQLNVGHAIRNPELAGVFLEYWTALAADPEANELKDWAEARNPLPPSGDADRLIHVFSPH
jgi:phosphatidylserine/phosphatidylglycerophosphate/cardiolipin synthase-like enzyme